MDLIAAQIVFLVMVVGLFLLVLILEHVANKRAMARLKAKKKAEEEAIEKQIDAVYRYAEQMRKGTHSCN